MEPWIVRMCREVLRRRVLAWVSVLLAGVMFLFASARYIQNFLAGPYALQPHELSQITDVEKTPRYFVSVQVEKVFDTGIQEITTTTRNGTEEGRYVSGGYYAVLVGGRFLIVKSSTSPSAKVEGELTNFPVDLSNQLFSGADGREIQSRCYPFYLETEGFRYPGYWGIGICVAFLALFLVYGRSSWARLQDLQKDPVVHRLYQWGDPIGISADAERELAGATHYGSQGVFITDKYVILKRFFVFNVLRCQDLLWAYKKVTKRSVNFIPTGKDYEAVLIFYGGSQSFRASDKVVEEVLAFMSSRVPWAVLGYSREIDKLFHKQTTSFCQAVEARREECMTKKA